MARRKAPIPDGVRLTNHLSVGVLARVYPQGVVGEALDACGRGSVRRRELPADLVVYLVIALGLYRAYPMGEVLRCLGDGLRQIDKSLRLRVPVSTSITLARERLGAEPFEELRRRVVKPLAERETKGCWYQGMRLMAIDGSTLSMPDEEGNRKAFGLPNGGRGKGAFPRARVTMLVEVGTHAIVAWQRGALREAEIRQAERLVPNLSAGMLVLADRYYGVYPLWEQAVQTGAGLLWRVRSNARLPVVEEYPDGSYRSVLRGGSRGPHKGCECSVRVIEYTLPANETVYRLVTNLPMRQAPATQLAELYHERWEIESTYSEIKAHLLAPGTGSCTALRSKTPELVRQEIDGVMLAHYVVRVAMYEAARLRNEDPDRIPFTHTVRVVRRRLQNPGAFPP